jgi:hypothetical protein
MPKGVGVQVPPRAEIHTLKLFILNNLHSKMLEQIQNLDPHRLTPDLNPRPLQATLFELGHTPIDAWIQKMDVDGDGGRREFGLRGQRRGTGSDKETAANSLSGYHALGVKKILACLRPCS